MRKACMWRGQNADRAEIEAKGQITARFETDYGHYLVRFDANGLKVITKDNDGRVLSTTRVLGNFDK